ncbi:MAG TPA: phosphatidate cytidylyltransferase [Acidobacteriaceae bacterium]|nr:phosphatidate cytidylyltransferase [Acidobacteriaceae bacterium]
MKRVLTAALLIAVVVALIFFGHQWMLALAACVVAEFAAYEYVSLANTGGARVPAWWMAIAVALFFYFTSYRPIEAQLPVLSLLALALLAWTGFHGALERVLPDAAIGLFGLVYVAYPLLLIPLIWNRDDGKALILFLMVCVWAGDIAALYVGRSFGRRKLTRLSPNKTWEGSIASVLGSLVAGLAVVYLGDLLSMRGNTVLHILAPVWESALMAVVLNIAAQVGDLLESAIKRGAGVKDSGTILPGHGGILDRIDALLLAAPVLWCMLLLKDAFGLGRF